MPVFKKIVFAVALGSLLVSLSACVSEKPPVADHKTKTTACLIRSSAQTPGSPDNQLATDLVEAQVVFGLAVREYEIPQAAFDVSQRLLKALQSGCVLMISSNMSYLKPLASFARSHPKMLVLFVGGSLSKIDQPSNFRWVADDYSSGAKFAGFISAGLSTDGKVSVFIAPNYYQGETLAKDFRAGLTYYALVSGKRTTLEVVRVKSASELKTELQKLEPNSVAAIFAGKSIWAGIKAVDTTELVVIGSDLQIGETVANIYSRVVGSVERNTSTFVLRAVDALLKRKVSSDPVYRVTQPLNSNLIGIESPTGNPLDSTLLEELQAYKDALIQNFLN